MLADRAPPRVASCRGAARPRAAGAALVGFCAVLAAARSPAAGWAGRGGALGLGALVHWLGRGGGPGDQLVYIVRHGDKYTSYPECTRGQDPVEGAMCFDREAMGINAPLTECGTKQAEYTTDWILNRSQGRALGRVVASPFARALQTALPLGRRLAKKIQVEYLLSEARQPEGPYRPYNAALPAFCLGQLAEIEGMWDLDYGSPPLRTPEDTPLYTERVARMTRVLKDRFPPSSGDMFLFTHATTAFSAAYGLCENLFGSLQEFVDRQLAVSAAGVIVATLDREGRCTHLAQTQNVAEAVGCGRTRPQKCEFSDYPNWYWEEPSGSGPARCH